MMKKEKKAQSDEGELEMTPMIDVVFQLLVFFIVTLKPEPVFAHLDIIRPAPDTNAPKEQPEDMINITVFREGVMLQRTPVSMETLEKKLRRLAAVSKNQTVLIKCTGVSMHTGLIQVLELCDNVEFTNLSVFSM